VTTLDTHTHIRTQTQAGPAAPGAAEASAWARALDCLQANLAVLADRHHGPGTHLRLGARLHFSPTTAEPADTPADPSAETRALPTVEPTLDAQLAASAEAFVYRAVS
jgi:hypothetical protein